METFYFFYFFTGGYLSCANERRWGGIGQQEVKNGQVLSVVVVPTAEGVGGNGWLGEREASYSTGGLISGS